MTNFTSSYIFVACFFIAGSGQKKSNGKDVPIGQIANSADISKKPTVELKQEEFDNLSDFANLVPVTLLNPKSKNAYEKYGIEFSGNCYACDLAAISVNKKSFDIINVCDKNDFYRDEKFTYQPSPKEFIVNTEKHQFIFTKIDNAPIYELKITEEKMKLKNKRLSKFYTQQKELHKFKQHDCGEFDG
jgi:hypothetical protein